MTDVLYETCRPIEWFLEIGCEHIREGIAQGPQMGEERLRQLLANALRIDFDEGAIPMRSAALQGKIKRELHDRG